VIGDATFWTAFAAVGACLSAFFAAWYTWLTFRLVRSQNEPNVILYVRHDESRPTILQIVIENIGRGLASEVQFTSSRSIPWHAWNSITNTSGPVQPMVEGPLINGIAALGPRDSRKLTWGQYKGLKQSIGDEPIIITCTYKHGARNMPPVVTKLEVASFALTDAVGSEGTRVIMELQRIANATEQAVRELQSEEKMFQNDIQKR
jgi:hypothetical protein